jgi:cytochrome c553
LCLHHLSPPPRLVPGLFLSDATTREPRRRHSLVGSCAVCHAIGAVSDTALPVLRPLLQFAGTNLDA